MSTEYRRTLPGVEFGWYLSPERRQIRVQVSPSRKGNQSMKTQTNAIAKMTVLKSEWITGEEAAEQLGYDSVRSIQRLAKDPGVLRFKQEGKSRLYHAGDVERVKEAGIKTERDEPTQPGGLIVRGGITVDVVRAIREAIETPRPVGIREKLWLTIAEASELSGRSHTWLLRVCHQGKLVAEKDGGWKILRRSLEEFRG